MRDEDRERHDHAEHAPPLPPPESPVDDRGVPHDPTRQVEERYQARKRSAVTARVVHKSVLEEGEDELARSTGALAWSGLAAGLSMGFSFLAQGILHEHLPPASWRPLISTLGYTVGFVLIVIGRQQLYTENTLTAVLPVLKVRTGAVLANMLRLWAVVLAANLVGAMLFALYLAHSGVAEPPLHFALSHVAREALGDHGFLTMLIRAIPAGWLIALIVWLGPALPTGRLWTVLILAWVVGIGKFGHIIAGSVDVMYLVFRGEAGWVEYLARFLAPVLVGNTIGGVVLVAMLNHAQATSGEES